METTLCPKCQQAVQNAPNYCPGCGADLRGLSPIADTYSGTWAGKVIDGRYKILEKLGEGGMGSVYRVEHVRMGKVLALKVLRPDYSLDKQAKARFHQEARVVSKLSHVNTIQVFDFGDLEEDGSLYLAMEYLGGRDLSWMLRAHGAMSEEQAIGIAVQVLASLSEAHEKGIVHRDIKPANVMLVKRKDREDLVKVLDFGIAKLNEAEGLKHITGVTEFIGTPAYMSPEQARGESLDARSDLYAVGAMLFELVSGKWVFSGPTPMSIVTKHLSEPPPRLSEVMAGKLVSPAFEAVIRKALEKKREDRYSDADQMRAALEKVRRELGALSPDFTPIPEDLSAQMASRADFDRFERSLRVRRALTPLLVLGLLGGAGYGGYSYLKSLDVAATRAVEREPNDLPAQATRIAPETEVRGTIGAASADRSDRDLYRVAVGQGPLAISVTGVEELNLSLEISEVLMEADGSHKLKRLLYLDDVGAGRAEGVDGYVPRTGELYLRIEEGRHYDEPRRGPREKANVEYVLRTRSLRSEGQLEVEPNDTLALATGCGVGKPVTGFLGAPVPYPPPSQLGVSTFSAVDYLLASSADPLGAVSAVVVAPPGGKLQVIDAATYETWELKAAAASKDPAAKPVPPRAPSTVGAEPELVVLGESSRGFGLRVQPALENAAPVGSSYRVAFITDGPTGLASAIALAASLADAGRGAERNAVLKLAATAFPDSPQIADVRSLLAQPSGEGTP